MSGLLTCIGSEDGSGGGEAQHPTDHLAIRCVEVVVTHGAPDPLMSHLHSPSGIARHETHRHCGDAKQHTHTEHQVQKASNRLRFGSHGFSGT